MCHLDTEEMALGVSLFKEQSSAQSRLAYAESTSLSMSQIRLPSNSMSHFNLSIVELSRKQFASMTLTMMGAK